MCDIFCTSSSHQMNASMWVYKICQSNAEQFHFLLKVFLIDVIIAFPKSQCLDAECKILAFTHFNTNDIEGKIKKSLYMIFRFDRSLLVLYIVPKK